MPVRETGQQVALDVAVLGDELYPDATFTLRMSFGAIKGWEEEGKPVEPYTDFAGLFRRHEERKGVPPFDLPARWAEAASMLNPDTKFNFVCTADIIGGNSGSPVVNTKGEVIGLVFDGNIQSLVGDYYFDERVNRTVCVDSRSIIEAMSKLYGANDLVAEITGKKIGTVGWLISVGMKALAAELAPLLGGEGVAAVESAGQRMQGGVS